MPCIAPVSSLRNDSRLTSSDISLSRLAPIDWTIRWFRQSPLTEDVLLSGYRNGSIGFSAFDGSFANDTARVVVLRSFTCVVSGYGLSWQETAVRVRSTTSFCAESWWDYYWQWRCCRGWFYGNWIDDEDYIDKQKVMGNLNAGSYHKISGIGLMSSLERLLRSTFHPAPPFQPHWYLSRSWTYLLQKILYRPKIMNHFFLF